MAEDRVTIRQVARSAGVSIATVSRVFAGSATVSDVLRQRVEEAAQELDYTPHEVARSLALGRTHVVGVLVPNLANPSVCGLIKHILQESGTARYRLIVADVDDDASLEVSMGTSLLQRTDGLIVYSPHSDTEVVESLAEHGKPVVVVNRRMESAKLSTVVVNSHDAVRALAGHLADRDHRRIAYLHGPERSTQDLERWLAVQSVRDRDIEVLGFPAGGTLNGGAEAVPAVLAAGCTAVMAFNDLTAFGVLRALRDAGQRVPEDVSVTGFDDVPFSCCVTPALTTARGRQRDAGTATWRMISGLLAGAEPSQTTFDAEPVFRDSTAPAPTA